MTVAPITVVLAPTVSHKGSLSGPRRKVVFCQVTLLERMRDQPGHGRTERVAGGVYAGSVWSLGFAGVVRGSAGGEGAGELGA